MSRIAKAPIKIPAGVEVKIANSTVAVKGPKGEQSFSLAPGIAVIEREDALEVRLERQHGTGRQNQHTRALSGTTRAMLLSLIHI